MKIASVCKTADFDFEDLLSSLNVSHKQFKTPLGIWKLEWKEANEVYKPTL